MTIIKLLSIKLLIEIKRSIYLKSPNINSKEFQSLEIPLPPLEVQNRIVKEVEKRLSHVAKLRQEAEAIVEHAKERVERILLAEV